MKKKIILLIVAILLLTTVVGITITFVYDSASDLIGTGSDFWSNRTEGTTLGARLDAPVLSMEFNYPNEGSYIQDNSLYNNFGVNSGAAYTASGSFDGSGYYVFVEGDSINISDNDATDIDASESLTVSIWVTYEGGTTDVAIEDGVGNAATGPYWNIRSNSNKSAIKIADASASTLLTGTSFINDSNWHHIVGRYDRSKSNLSIWVDGNMENSVTSTVGDLSNTAETLIGYSASGAQYWNGNIDEVKVWDRTLSDDEISQLYNGVINNSEYIGKYNRNGYFMTKVFQNYTGYNNYWNITTSIAVTNGSCYQTGYGCIDAKIPKNGSIIGYWSLDGDYNDTGNIGSNDGTPTGTNNATGISSGAIRFDGLDDFINTSDIDELDSTQYLTFSFWINPKSLRDYMGIIQKQLSTSSRVTIHLSGAAQGTNDDIQFTMQDIAASGDSIWTTGNYISTNTWHHVVAVFDGTQATSSDRVKIYINGILGSSDEFGEMNDTTPDMSGANVIIGNDVQAAGRFFNGSIDEVLIYNKSLSVSEVKDLYKAGLSQHANTNITLETRTATSYNITDANLVSFYPMNGSANDIKGSTNGAVEGATNGDSYGIVGDGYLFDGINDYINYGDVLDLTFAGSFSVGAWFKPNDLISQQSIIGKWWDGSKRNFKVEIVGDDLYFEHSNNAGDTTYQNKYSDSIVQDKWHYVVYTKTAAGDKRLYLNGVLVNSTTLAQNTENSAPLRIGNSNHSGVNQEFFNGSIDEVRIYNRILSADEIKNLYEMGSYHIEDWTAWTDEGKLTDEIVDTSTNLGQFIQYKFNFNTNDTDVSSYLLNYNITVTLPPTIDSVILNSTDPATNYTIENLTVWVTTSGTTATNYYYDWYKNGVLNLSINSSYSNTTLTYTNTTKGDIWFVGVIAEGSGANSTQTNSSNITIRNSPPVGTDIEWLTTGGLTDNTLFYNQVLDWINASATDNDMENLTFNITVTDPDAVKVVNSVEMTDINGTTATYISDISLNKVGTWNISIVFNDSEESSSYYETIAVNITQQSLIDGFYGYDTQEVPNNLTIEGLAEYGYDIIEIYVNSSYLGLNWSTILEGITRMNELNIKTGLKILLDYNLTIDTVNRTHLLHNISHYFDNLTDAPYIDTIEYIKFDIQTGYGIDYLDTNITDDNLDIIGENATSVVSNEFVIYSNYNSSTLDTDYIQYAEDLIYVSESSNQTLVEQLANLTRSVTSKTRIYYNISNEQKTITQTYQDNIMTQIIADINTTTGISNINVSELTGGGLIVYNPSSNTINVTYNVTNGTNVVGYDIWDYTGGILVENNTDGNITFLNIAPYEAKMYGTEQIDHIEMTSLTEGNVDEQTVATASIANYTDGVGDAARALSTARAGEYWDPTYVSPTSMLFYGDFSAQDSGAAVQFPYVFDGLKHLIINDQDDTYIDQLFWSNVSIDYVYGYIAVADYGADPNSCNATWVAAKKAEVDVWLAFNGSLNIFIDGFDLGNVNDQGCFFDDVKEVTDYIKTDKVSEVGANIFTNYQEFAQLASTFAMKESCIRKWASCVKGTEGCTGSYNASHGYTYSNQYWEDEDGYGDYNKSIWYQNHNVDVICVMFGERNNSAYYPDSLQGTYNSNYSLMEKSYLKARVLGYTEIVFTDPGFSLAYFDKYRDVGTKLQSEPTVSNDLYSMRYTNGIAYYNSTSDTAWFDEGLVFNNASLTFYLFDDAVYTNNVVVNNKYDYVISTVGSGWTAASGYPKFTIYLNESVWEESKGHYYVNISSGDGGFIAADAKHPAIHPRVSFYDNSGVWGIDGDGYGQLMAYLTVNVSRSGTIDTTSQITQTNVSVTSSTERLTNVTITAIYEFNTKVWTYVTTLTTGTFRKVLAWTGSSFENLNYNDDTACLTSSPNFFLNQVTNKGQVGVCVDTSGTGVSVRVQWSKLSEQIFQVNMDDIAPPITINYPAAGERYSNTTYESYVNITIPEDGGNCSINDTRWSFDSGNLRNFSFTNNTGIGDAVISLNISCWDNFSNNGSTTLSFTIDSIAPLVSIIYPTNNSKIGNNSIDLNVSVTDALATTFTYYYVINGTTNTTVTDGNSTLNASDGYYNLTVFVSDGLQNGSNSSYFYLDGTAPNVTLITPINITTITTSSSSLNYIVSDFLNITNCSLYVGGDLKQTNNNTDNFTYDFVSNGNYNWSVYCSDEVNNIGTSKTWLITVNVPGAVTTTPSSGGSASQVEITVGEESTKKAGLSTCPETTLIEKLFSDCRMPNNEVCDYNEFLIFDEDCNIDMEDFQSGELFAQVWLLRLLLVTIAFMFVKKNPNLPVVVIIFIVLLVTNGMLTFNLFESTEQVEVESVPTGEVWDRWVNYLTVENQVLGAIVAIVVIWFMFTILPKYFNKKRR